MAPIEMYEQAAQDAFAVASVVTAEQLDWPTPCSEWTVQDLLDHLTGGTQYLLSGIEGREPSPVADSDADTFKHGVQAVSAGLRQPGAMERFCRSPLGFDWPIAQAVMGTVMDLVVHTWDLATAIQQPVTLNPELVGFCVATFLPDMPERGRAAGIVGPATAVADDATADIRLLAAMGRPV